MRFRTIDAFLLATAVALSDIVWTASRFVLIAYRALFPTETEASIRAVLMHPVARVASDSPMIFVALICAIGFAAGFLSRSRQSQAWVLLGATLQCVIAWIAFFCFCFDSFTGWMCLHHGPEFELGRFITAAWGVFPITLATLLVFLAVAIHLMRKKNRPNHTPESIRRPADGPPKPSV